MNINIYRKNGILNINSGGRRGAQGDPGVVQSVNGKSEQDITLTPEDIGADPAGSATQAELNAKQYTDSVVAQAVAEVLSRTIELE